MDNLNINFANDLGYSYIKGNFDGTVVKIPSVMSIKRNGDNYDPIDFAELDSEKQTEQIDNLLKQLDVNVISGAIGTRQRLLVGQSAINSRKLLNRLDIHDPQGKAATDLSIILTLATIAGCAIQKAYQTKHKLPKVINVHVNMATALPIVEGKRNQTINNYKARFTDQTHQVILNNFTQEIKVNIIFDTVFVALEGETAQYALKYSNDDLKQMVKNDFDTHYPELANRITGSELTNYQNVLGVDIGSGTTDFPVFTDGMLNQAASTSLNQGWGNVLDRAKNELTAQKFNVSSVDDLQQILAQKNSDPLNSGNYDIVKQAVNNHAPELVDAIIEAISATLRSVSNQVNLIFVYGGGSIPLEAYLRAKLVAKAKHFSKSLFVVFINPKYAQQMNELGLNTILAKVAQAKAQSKTK